MSNITSYNPDEIKQVRTRIEECLDVDDNGIWEIEAGSISTICYEPEMMDIFDIWSGTDSTDAEDINSFFRVIKLRYRCIRVIKDERNVSVLQLRPL
jgi:hypothetical protein